MINIILNEKRYAETVFNQKYLDKKPTLDLYILAKYFYEEKKYTPNKIYLELVKIMEEKYNNFSLAKWQSILLDLSKNAIKYQLLQIDYIPLTKNELVTIDNIESRTMKRLAFTLLCLAKYKNIINSKNNDWENYKFSEIFKMANIQANKKEQALMIYALRNLGLIKMNKLVDNLSINVCYIDKQSSEEVLQIRDFRNLGYEYLLYCGEKYIRCENCGILVRKRGTTDKYCTECKQIKQLEWQKSSMKKIRQE